jgi:hypothetical protein
VSKKIYNFHTKNTLKKRAKAKNLMCWIFTRQIVSGTSVYFSSLKIINDFKEVVAPKALKKSELLLFFKEKKIWACEDSYTINWMKKFANLYFR